MELVLKAKRFTCLSLVALLILADEVRSTVCPLCGEFPVSQPPPIPNEDFVLFNFDICCPFVENNVQDCVVDPSGEAERVTGLDTPLVNGLEFVSFCMTFDNFLFEKSDRTPCCESCSCFGDPNCISFDGTEEMWIVCDGRKVPSNPSKRERGFCKITEDQCTQELDPFGQPCRWLPAEQGIDSEDWVIRTMGGPCRPTGIFFTTMYQADTFQLEIGQGDRGFIVETRLTLGTKTYRLTADNCVYRGLTTSWTGDSPIPPTFHRSKETGAPDGNNDIIWDLFDQTTGIGVKIRCTSTKDLAVRLNPHMNIEAINEPDPNFRLSRSSLGGFCATNSLGNEYPSENSNFIDSNGNCFANAANNNVTIARIICENPAITRNGVEQCLQDFCNHFFYPFYINVESCLNNMRNDNAKGFCKAFNQLQGDVLECMAIIEEEGWKQAAAVYYNKDRPKENCVNDFKMLPTSLAPCEKGVLLQYFDEDSKQWLTAKAVSEKQPVCANADLSICFEDYPELFTNKIRWMQKREVAGCLYDKCDQQDGFSVRLRTQRITSDPTSAPTKSPTPAPTKNPTSSPTLSPTVSPTRFPTESPTSSPTSAPTAHPTESPTNLPTSSPTSSPTESPTRFPTGNPTSHPTESPTPAPTRSPTNSPTPLPTNSPSLSPSPYPSNSPSTSPTFPEPLPFLCPPQFRVPLSINNSNIRFNNLGGKGPRVNDTCPFIWYENVVVIEGTSTDLILRVIDGEYRPSNVDPDANDGVSNNGKYFELGQVNLACNSAVFLEFVFIRHDCPISTSDPCSIATNRECDIFPDVEGIADGLLWTTYDLDRHENNKNVEDVVYCNVQRALEVPDTKVEIEMIGDLDGCPNATEIRATVFGDEADNPKIQDIDALTLDQRQRLGRVELMTGISRLQARYSITGPDRPDSRPRCGRRILFSADYCDLPSGFFDDPYAFLDDDAVLETPQP